MKNFVDSSDEYEQAVKRDKNQKNEVKPKKNIQIINQKISLTVKIKIN